MTVQELIDILETLHPEDDVFVHLFRADGTEEMFEIREVRGNHGHIQLDIAEAAEP